MDLNIKIYELFYTIFVTIKLINGLNNTVTKAKDLDQVKLKQNIMTSPTPLGSPYGPSFKADWHYGVVPYYIDTDSYDKNLKQRIQKAMAIIEASSCIIFREETEKPDDLPLDKTMAWLHFTNPEKQRECSHNMVKGHDGDIIIVLGIECLRMSEILHSVLHALGFKDEVTHPHRDQYVRVLWENIKPSYRSLFRVLPETASHKLVEYDPMSIMHFHDRAYSDNGGLTIVTVMPGLVISPSEKLSQLDVMKLRIMFGHECNKRKVGDLIDNCKNVLYKGDKQKSSSEGGKIDTTKEETIEDNEDHTQLNAEDRENDGDIKALHAPEEEKDEDYKPIDATEEGTDEDHKEVDATEEGNYGDYKLLRATRKGKDGNIKHLGATKKGKDENHKQLYATKKEKDGDIKPLDATEEGKHGDIIQFHATKKEKDIDMKPLDATKKGRDGDIKQLGPTEKGVDENVKKIHATEEEDVKKALNAKVNDVDNDIVINRRENPIHLWKYNSYKLH